MRSIFYRSGAGLWNRSEGVAPYAIGALSAGTYDVDDGLQVRQVVVTAPVLPNVTIGAAQSQAEGNSGTLTWTIPVYRSSTAGAVTVNITFAAGGTNAADWQGNALPSNLSVNMADGVGTANLVLTSVGDVTAEGNEGWTVQLVAPSGYQLGNPNSMTGTILNDDTSAPEFNTILIKGDSITSNTPFNNGAVDDYYSYRWRADNPGKVVYVAAQSSKSVGGAAYNGDLLDNSHGSGNTLWDNKVADLTYAPDLVTFMIGVNDISSNGVQVPTMIQRLKDYAAWWRANSTAKLAYGSPTPAALSGGRTQQDQDFYLGKWNQLWAAQNVRNPANWSQWADYYIPTGEYPDYLTNGPALIPDGVHLGGPLTSALTGQFLLNAVYKAAMTTLMDQSRQNSPGPYESVWAAFGPFTNLAPGVPITRRVLLSGLAWAGRAEGTSVTGGNAAVLINGKVAPMGAYNGDLVDLTFTPSAQYETDAPIQLTIGGETRTLTYRTGANVAPVAYIHGDVIGQGAGDPTAHLYENLAFAGGTGRIGIVTVASGQHCLGVKANNVAATPIYASQDGDYGGARLRSFWFPAPLNEYDIEVTLGGGYNVSEISYGTVTGANSATITGVAASGDGDDSPPHFTSNGTVASNGLALGFLGVGASDVTITAQNGELIDTGIAPVFNGNIQTLAISKRTTSGVISWNGSFGPHPRAIIVFEPG